MIIIIITSYTRFTYNIIDQFSYNIIDQRNPQMFISE